MFKRHRKKDLDIADETLIYSKRDKENEDIVESIKHESTHLNKNISTYDHESKENLSSNFVYYDTDSQSDCSLGKDINKRKKKQKRDLSSFFEKSKIENNLMKKQESSLNERTSSEAQSYSEDKHFIEDDTFTFRNNKFSKVEDFIQYLDDNYIDIEDISLEALNDEKYYEWLKRKSNAFEDSIKQFKDIKEKIEEN